MIKFIATQYFWEQQKENIITACFEEDDTLAAGCFSPPCFPHRFLSLYPISRLLVYLDCLSSLASSSSSFSPHPCFHCCSPSPAHFICILSPTFNFSLIFILLFYFLLLFGDLYSVLTSLSPVAFPSLVSFQTLLPHLAF